MNEEEIRRINELAKKAKSPEGLTEAEKKERAVLRRAFRFSDVFAGKRKPFYSEKQKIQSC